MTTAAPKLRAACGDALVVRGDDHLGGAARHGALVDVTDHRPAGEQRERLARKSRRRVARRDHDPEVSHGRLAPGAGLAQRMAQPRAGSRPRRRGAITTSAGSCQTAGSLQRGYFTASFSVISIGQSRSRRRLVQVHAAVVRHVDGDRLDADGAQAGQEPRRIADAGHSPGLLARKG